MAKKFDLKDEVVVIVGSGAGGGCRAEGRQWASGYGYEFGAAGLHAVPAGDAA